MGFWESTTILSWLAIAFLAIAMYGLTRQLSAVQRPVFTSSPRSHLPALPEAVLRVSDRPFVGLFVEPSCLACTQRLEDLARASAQMEEIQVILFAERSGADRISRPSRAKLISLDQSLAELGVPATPFGILVANGELIQSGPIGSEQALLELIYSALATAGKSQEQSMTRLGAMA